MFDEVKGTNLARLILQDLGGECHKTKLMKLLYLMERRMIERYGDFILKDRFVAFKNGMALLEMFNLISSRAKNVFYEYIEKIKERKILKLRLGKNSQNLRENFTSEELACYDEVMKKYGNMDPKKIVERIHENCPEWREKEQSIGEITLGEGKHGASMVPLSLILPFIENPPPFEDLFKKLMGDELGSLLSETL